MQPTQRCAPAPSRPCASRSTAPRSRKCHIPPGPSLSDACVPLFHGHVIRVGIAGPASAPVDRGQNLFGQLTAQLDIHTAASHVGGDGHRAKRAGSGDDLAFFGVLAGIQHLVRDAALQDRLPGAPGLVVSQIQDWAERWPGFPGLQG